MFIETVQLRQKYYSFHHREYFVECITVNRDGTVKLHRLHDDDMEENREWTISHENIAMISRLINMTNFTKFHKCYIRTMKRHQPYHHPMDDSRGFEHLMQIGVLFTSGKWHNTEFRKKDQDTPESLTGLADQLIDLCEAIEQGK